MRDNDNNLKSVPLSEKWFKDVPPKAKNHLLSSLHSLELGHDPTPSFKLYGKDDISVATDFINMIKGKEGLPEWLVPYEESRLEKFGPQGGYAPWSELRENAVMYFTRALPTNVQPNSVTINKYRKYHIDMLSVSDALNTLKNDDKIKDRAAGWTDFNLKKTNADAQSHALKLAKSGKWVNGWAYFFSRYNKKKKRLFIPMPYSSMIVQAQYFNPFLKKIQEDLRINKSNSSFKFWADKIGFGPCFEEIIGNALSHYDNNHLVYIMRDFEKMDTTCGPTQKEACFIPKLAAMLRFKKGSAPYKALTEAMLFSNYCPIATPEGMWLTETGRGEASGATVTNGGETCVNEDYDQALQDMILQECIKEGIEFQILISVGNGDDGATVGYLPDLSKFEALKKIIAYCANKVADIFRLRVQGEKWDIIIGHGKYCQYLFYNDNGITRYMYPAVLILNSIVNPEHQYNPSQWDKDYRDLDIIEKLDNGCGLPYYHELIDYVDNGMKYRLLGRSEQETSRILSKFERYRALQDESRKFNFVSEELEADISKSPTVKYLLEKRRHSS